MWGGIIPTIGASHFGAEIWIMEKVRIKQNNKQGFAECEVGGWQILNKLQARQGEVE